MAGFVELNFDIDNSWSFSRRGWPGLSNVFANAAFVAAAELSFLAGVDYVDLSAGGWFGFAVVVVDNFGGADDEVSDGVGYAGLLYPNLLGFFLAANSAAFLFFSSCLSL